jgi:hypothetical protein
MSSLGDGFKPHPPHYYVENCGGFIRRLSACVSEDFDFVEVADEFEAGFQEFAGFFFRPFCFGNALVIFHLYQVCADQRTFRRALGVSPVSTIKARKSRRKSEGGIMGMRSRSALLLTRCLCRRFCCPHFHRLRRSILGQMDMRRMPWLRAQCLVRRPYRQRSRLLAS